MNAKPLKLLFEAMYHGKYDFQDFLCGDISSDFDMFTVGEREIYRPNKKLKTYHSFINLFILEKLPVNTSVVYSYRKGVNVYDAVSKHALSKHFFQTDISRFFPSIKVELVRNTLLKNHDCTPISDLSVHIDRIIELVMVDGGLPVGFSTSPLISNVCLFDFDNIVQEYCVAHNIIYTRYSDDLIFSSKEREGLIDIPKFLQNVMLKIFNGSIFLNVSKTKFTHAGSKIKLLGMVILPNGKVSVDKKFKDNIEVLLHFYVKDRKKFFDLVESDLKGGMEKISGYLSYVNTVDKDYLNKLRKKYGMTVVDMFLHYAPKK